MMTKTEPVSPPAGTDGAAERGVPAVAIRWRYPIALSLPLIVLNCGWIANSEIRNNLTEGTVSTLFMGVLFILFILTLLNLLVRRRLGARAALNQPELMVVYTLLSLSSAIAGVSNIGFLALALGSPSAYTMNNRGVTDILPLLPAAMGPRDPVVLQGFYQGHSTFFRAAAVAAWAYPLAVWGVFLLVLLWTMLCLSAILRGRWADEEHLPFPVIALPLEITREGAPIYRSRALWAGFAIPCFLHSLNTLQGWYPALPSLKINTFHEMDSGLPYPWTGLDSFLVLVHPVGVGFGYLVGTDMSFSLWFFYLLKKALGVTGVALGWRDPRPGDWDADSAGQFPFTSYQGWGAWTALALAALWIGRKYFREYFARALRGGPAADGMNEPLSPRAAIIGFVLGFLALCAFVRSSGGSLWLPIAFLGIYLLIMIAISRLRAETAVLSTGLGIINPQAMLTTLVGTQEMQPVDLAHLGMLSWFNMDYRSAAMPQELEGLVGLRRARGDLRPMAGAMLLAMVVSIVAAMLWTLQMYYVNGAASAEVVSWRSSAVTSTWKHFETWRHDPSGPSADGILAMAAGFGITFLLAALRARFFGFPFHPAGYVVNTSPANNYFWLDMFIAWLVKSLILRYGGLGLYRAALPFFYGLILGDFVTGAAWCIVGTVLHVSLFRTFPV
jgi:hypothetical protein